jgi:hypothetical protein
MTLFYIVTELRRLAEQSLSCVDLSQLNLFAHGPITESV